MGILDRVAVDNGDDIARKDAGLSGGAIRLRAPTLPFMPRPSAIWAVTG
jgi:hypothetical protein